LKIKYKSSYFYFKNRSPV